jgi:DNA-binding NarL/FixJ family response regulator
MVSDASTSGLKFTNSREKDAKIKILLADNHRMVSQGLRFLLQQEPDFEVVGEADNGAEALRLARELKPDVIVLEACLPAPSSVEIIKRLGNFEKTRAILILTAPEEDNLALELVLAGASGCVFRTASYSELAQAIRVITMGQFICDQTLERKFLKRIIIRNSLTGGTTEQLTPREMEILNLAAQGLNNQDIASRLVLTTGTVKGYFGNIFSKMNVNSRTGAVMEGVKYGWISLEN